MKISILGTGAIGSIFAAGLADHHELTCVVKTQAHADAINDSGIRIAEKDGSTRTVYPKAVTNTQGAKPSDLVLIAVKAPATWTAVRQHSSLFGEQTIAVSLQNGYGNHKDMESVINPDHIIIGTTSQGANIASGGQINHAGSGLTTIGALRPQTPGAGEMLTLTAQIFNEAGLETVITEDAEDAVIRKLFVNVGINAVCTLNDCQNKYISSDPEMRAYARQLVEEAVEIFSSAGRKYDANAIWEHVESVAQATGENICSMLQDMRNGRQTEIRRINGAVAQLASERNMAAPLNRNITEKIERLTDSQNSRS